MFRTLNRQASFVVHYVHDMAIKEHCIPLCNIQSTTGEKTENFVMNIWKENHLKTEDIRGQGHPA